MRILWLSFVDAEQNAPYFERLSRYLNDIAAQDTTVDVAGTSPPDRDFSRLTEFRCAALAIDGHNACGAFGYASAPRLGQAQNTALQYCYRNGGKDCVIRAWVCDGKG